VRRASTAAAIFLTCATLVGACGSFTGQDQSTPISSGSDASDGDTVSAAGDSSARPLDAMSPTDAGTSAGDHGDADAAVCVPLIQQHFDDAALPVAWGPSTMGGNAPNLDTTEHVSAPSSLHVRVLTSDMNAHSSLLYVASPMVPAHARLQYAVMTSAWDGFDHVDFGCSLELEAGGSPHYLDFEDDQGSIYHLIASPPDMPATASGAGLSPMTWYTVTLDVTGLDTPDKAVAVLEARKQSDATLAASATLNFTVPMISSLVINCGIGEVVTTGTPSAIYDVWIDDVTFSSCP
jgi:hypothetical protein